MGRRTRSRKLRAHSHTPSSSPVRNRRRARPINRQVSRFLRRKRNRSYLLAAAAFVLVAAIVLALVPGGWPRKMLVTAYCPCAECCGPNAHGVTASGRPVSANGGKFVAADGRLPFGTLLVIPGYNDGKPVQVLDRGGAIKGDHLDVFFPTHEQAKRWGAKWLVVDRVGPR